jgi:hypothetical protein
MKNYYKIKEEKKSEYKNLKKGFIQFPLTLSERNLNKEDGVYYYWRLKDNSQDEVVVTAIKIEDLEEA